MNAYEAVKGARDIKRPVASDYIKNIFTTFIEQHGDRLGGDDSAVIAGIGLLGRIPATVIGLEKGRDTDERVKRNFGAAHPEGYRKALRQMKLAEKFHRPIICFIDTSGAFCGVDAEHHGQSRAISECITEMSSLKTPIISIIIGEGGSGGALGLAVCDELWMVSGAYYSVISPESCANILWKDSSRAAEAAECLHLTDCDMIKLKVAERIVGENLNITEQTGRDALYTEMRQLLISTVKEKSELDAATLMQQRYVRFRQF